MNECNIISEFQNKFNGLVSIRGKIDYRSRKGTRMMERSKSRMIEDFSIKVKH